MTKHTKWTRSGIAAWFLLGAASCGSSDNNNGASGNPSGQNNLPATATAGKAGTAGTTAAAGKAAAGVGGTAPTAIAGSAANTAGKAGTAAAAGNSAGRAGTIANAAGAIAGGGAGSSGAAGVGAAGMGAAGADSDSGTLGGALMYTGSFTMGMTIPPENKCPMSAIGGGTGDNKSPALSWQGGPTDTKSFAIVLFDTRYNMLHWVLWDIPATVNELPEGLASGYELTIPAGAHQAASMGNDPHAYYGPCSSGTAAGMYEYRLYALKIDKLSLTESSTGAQAQSAVEAAQLEMTVWSGKPE